MVEQCSKLEHKDKVRREGRLRLKRVGRFQYQCSRQSRSLRRVSCELRHPFWYSGQGQGRQGGLAAGRVCSGVPVWPHHRLLPHQEAGPPRQDALRAGAAALRGGAARRHDAVHAPGVTGPLPKGAACCIWRGDDTIDMERRMRLRIRMEINKLGKQKREALWP